MIEIKSVTLKRPAGSILQRRVHVEHLGASASDFIRVIRLVEKDNPTRLVIEAIHHVEDGRARRVREVPYHNVAIIDWVETHEDTHEKED
jgi:hypothetical protein